MDESLMSRALNGNIKWNSWLCYFRCYE